MIGKVPAMIGEVLQYFGPVSRYRANIVQRIGAVSRYSHPSPVNHKENAHLLKIFPVHDGPNKVGQDSVEL